ncbi:hypothetical protein, partial [Vibrio alginolyticus]|uniref:hypothetical protein n=1 Tax=Vibrio alginolyticus TaxID=663 RepID=UPI00215EE5D4
SKIIQHSINLNFMMAILMIEFKEELSDKLNKKYPHNTGKTERSVSCGFKTIVLLLIRTTNVGMQWKYK